MRSRLKVGTSRGGPSHLSNVHTRIRRRRAPCYGRSMRREWWLLLPLFASDCGGRTHLLAVADTGSAVEQGGGSTSGGDEAGAEDGSAEANGPRSSVGSGSSSGSTGSSSSSGAGPDSQAAGSSSGLSNGSDGAAECQVSDDCAALLGPLPSNCTQCPSGGQGCEHYVCLSGVCHTAFCGTQPAPSTNECQTPSDCLALLGPLPPFGTTCPNGSEGYEHYVCLSGLCQTTFCK